jgi:hypothetical protein
MSSILGYIKANGITNVQLPPKATSGRACTYGGQEYIAVVIQMKFESPEAARAYMQSVRDGLRTKKGKIETTSEKFEGVDGFSFSSGMLAANKDFVLRVSVNPRIATGKGGIHADLTRQVMLLALKSN